MKPRPSGKAGFCTPSRTRVAIVAIAAIVLLSVVTRPSPSVASVSAVDSGASKHRRQLERGEQQQLEGKLRAEEEAEGEGGSVEEAEADDDGHGSTDDTDMGQHAAAQVEAQDAAERGWGEEQAAEAGGGGGGGTGGGTNLRKQWGEGPSEYAAALAGCTDLACLTMAAQKPRYPGQFLFPSFFVVGWQKSATTSLFFHLRGHPQVAAAHTKEPEFFSEQCGYRPTHCPQDAQEEYIHRVLRLPDVLESQLTSLSAEASTHYGRNGALLASGIHKVFPWLRIIASVREPINRAISMLAHNLDLSSKGCLTRREVYTCLKKELPGLNYSEPWEAWLQAWPRTQLYLVQYENMTSEESGVQVLQDIKRFLHIDPNLPATVEDDGSAGLPTLSQHNTRAQHLQRKGELKEGEEPEGWPIKRRQYEELLDIVRPDAERLAKLVRQHGFADSKEWLENWEMQWQATLDTCDKRGNCMIFP